MTPFTTYPQAASPKPPAPPQQATMPTYADPVDPFSSDRAGDASGRFELAPDGHVGLHMHSAPASCLQLPLPASRVLQMPVTPMPLEPPPGLPAAAAAPMRLPPRLAAPVAPASTSVPDLIAPFASGLKSDNVDNNQNNHQPDHRSPTSEFSPPAPPRAPTDATQQRRPPTTSGKQGFTSHFGSSHFGCKEDCGDRHFGEREEVQLNTTGSSGLKLRPRQTDALSPCRSGSGSRSATPSGPSQPFVDGRSVGGGGAGPPKISSRVDPSGVDEAAAGTLNRDRALLKKMEEIAASAEAASQTALAALRIVEAKQESKAESF